MLLIANKSAKNFIGHFYIESLDVMYFGKREHWFAILHLLNLHSFNSAYVTVFRI
jgi:hypothetical protein